MRQLISVFVFVLLAAGCMERVRLPDPPADDAPLKTRIAAFRKLEPTSSIVTTAFQQNVAAQVVTDSLVLRGGWRVSDPRDLLPVIREDSPSVTYIHGWDSKTRTAATLYWVSAGSYVLGGVAMFGGRALEPASPNYTSSISFIGGTALIGLASVGVLIGVFEELMAYRDRTTAFATYPQSLAERLRVTPEDLEAERSGDHADTDRNVTKIRYDTLPANLRPAFLMGTMGGSSR